MTGPLQLTFVTSAVDISTLPGSPAEVAVVGRSNVGKSSLVNGLTGRRMLARTSQTPGRTRQLIFFNLADRLQLVDLPGYGYASAPKTDIKAWTNLTRKYLAGRPSLQRVFLLIDSRRGVGPADHDVRFSFNFEQCHREIPAIRSLLRAVQNGQHPATPQKYGQPGFSWGSIAVGMPESKSSGE